MKKVLKSFCILLVMIAMVNTTALAAAPNEPADPQSNKYIWTTTVGIVALGSGKIEIDASVTATNKMADVGITRIAVYKEGGTRVAEYWYTDPGYESMIGHNKATHTVSVTYQGVPGERYYATVSFYAGEMGVAGGGHSMLSPAIYA